MQYWVVVFSFLLWLWFSLMTNWFDHHRKFRHINLNKANLTYSLNLFYCHMGLCHKFLQAKLTLPLKIYNLNSLPAPGLHVVSIVNTGTQNPPPPPQFPGIWVGIGYLILHNRPPAKREPAIHVDMISSSVFALHVTQPLKFRLRKTRFGAYNSINLLSNKTYVQLVLWWTVFQTVLWLPTTYARIEKYVNHNWSRV